MSEKNPIEWHDIYCAESDIRLRVGPDVLAHFSMESIKADAPQMKRTLDAEGVHGEFDLKRTLSGMMGGMEIICYAHLLNEGGKKVPVYYIDSMARYKKWNSGTWN